VLRLLLEAEGKVVTREHLRSALWPEDTFVDFEHGVNTAVKKLRQALEDSAENPSFIETLPKVGYRFIRPVEWEAETRTGSPLAIVVPIASPEKTPAQHQLHLGRTGRLIFAIALFVVALATAVGFLMGGNRRLSHGQLGMSLRRRTGSSTSPVAMTQRRLTANPNDTPLTGGVISPDGKYLVYTDPGGFYVRQIEGGETHPVSLPQGFQPIPESWFPDSVHLVVSWFGDQKHQLNGEVPDTGPPSLWKISVLGGAPRKLSDRGSSARVSSDGTKIAFLAGP
jgi:DNA-binding winged helix-turn-helix (wHTH) protein